MLYNRNDKNFSTTLRLQNYGADICVKRVPFSDDKEKIETRNKKFKKILIELLKVLPERESPINPKLVGETDMGEYLCERIYFDAEPGTTIPALFYKPKQKIKRPMPVVILVHGWLQNKEHFPLVKARLVAEGYCAISIDIISHGERRIVASVEEDTQNAIGYSLALGVPLMGLCVRDLIRTVDYLETKKDIDPERIGIMGLCLGGMQTYFTAALENRLKVIIPVCSNSTYGYMVNEMAAYHTHCLFTYIPNFLKFGDIQDVIALIAPRPLLLMNNYNDIWFPISGFKKLCSEIEMIYSTLGNPERFKYLVRDTVHDITPEFLEHAIEWLKRYL